MLQVMIIDDEPIIREGLKTIIDWAAYGFEICGEAGNGIDGLDKISRLKPDLAIVDIKMPMMDGLQMVRELRSKGLDCECIILSAYSDFKFAQQAIELGIGSYILKPIEQDELIDKILKIREAIQEKRQTKQYLEYSVALSKDKILQHVVLGDRMSADMEKQYALYGLDFPWKSYRVGLVDMGKKAYEATELRVCIEHMVETFVAERSLGYSFSIDRYIGILFRSPVQTRILNDLHRLLESTCSLDATISLGIVVSALDAVTSSYQSASRLLDKRFLYEYKKVITGTEAFKSAKMTERSLPETGIDLDRTIDAFCRAIDGESTALINDLLEHIRNTYIIEERDEDQIKIDYSNLYIAIAGKLSQNAETAKALLYDRQEVLAEIRSKTSLQELHGYMKFLLLAITEELSRLRPGDAIKKITDYVARNYNHDIKLESLATLFHYNSAYLGKLIRAKMGMQFSTYLDHVRIEEAKRLLKEGHKVYEVAQMTGFRYIDYFYKKFKKYVGVPPSDYRGSD